MRLRLTPPRSSFTPPILFILSYPSLFPSSLSLSPSPSPPLSILSSLPLPLTQFDSGRAVFSGEYTTEEIVNFVLTEQLPLVTKFSDEVRRSHPLHTLCILVYPCILSVYTLLYSCIPLYTLCVFLYTLVYSLCILVYYRLKASSHINPCLSSLADGSQDLWW